MTDTGPAQGRKEIVVCVDDDPDVLSALRRLFENETYEVQTTERPAEALEWVQARDVGLVISDQRMPGMSGIELLEAVARHSPTTVRILLTAYPGAVVAVQSPSEGGFLMIGKPWDGDEIKRIVRAGLDSRAAARPKG